MTLDLAPEERRALAALLKGIVNEGHPHSPRIRLLQGILARLEPPGRERLSILGRNAVEIRRTSARLIVRGIVSFLRSCLCSISIGALVGRLADHLPLRLLVLACGADAALVSPHQHAPSRVWPRVGML